jgi:phenylacetate-coenzyme A ligase PaaK-like adenylate-forming protein
MTKAEYMRQYYLKNKDKYKARYRETFEATREARLERCRKWRQANPNYLREWRAKNRDKPKKPKPQPTFKQMPVTIRYDR